jgi:cellulose synthase/poly-beta-1,6-N-acetylglucosamine synthase-like glycosyltransferase
MRLILWVALAGIVYTYAGYPLAIWVLARIYPRRWNVASITPSVSIVLAVHNGAALLQRKVDHLLELDYSNIKEIIIVSDGSNDRTAELLRRLEHPKIRTIVLNEHSGKAAAVSAGMSQASAEVILFVDIRPEIAPGAIHKLVSNFADPKVGCVAGQLVLRQDNHDSTTAAIGGLYWRYEEWIRKCESVFDSPVGVYGGFYAVRRELAVQQPAGIILDDMFQPLSIIRQGYRSVLDLKARVYDTWPKQANGEYRRKVRTLAGNFQLFQLAPWSLTLQNRVFFQFVSHKVMRLIVPYLFILTFICAVALAFVSSVFAVFAVLQVLAYTVAIISLVFKVPVLHRITAPAGAMLLLNAAAVVGLYRFLMTRGPLWKIWIPQEMGPTS